MKNKIQLELARWVVATARKHGAAETSVDIGHVRQAEIACRAGKLETLKESTQNNLTLTVYVDDRSSTHSTADLRREGLDRFISEAVAMTRYLSQDPQRRLPDPKYYAGRQDIDLKLRDPDADSFGPEKRVALAKEIEQAALSTSDRIISCTAEVSDAFGESVKVHSNGFEGSRSSTTYGASVDVTVKGEDGGRPEAADWRRVRFHRDLPTPEELSDRAVTRALRRIGAGKLDSGRYDVIVENRSVARLLRGLFRPLGGRALQQKSSFLEGKLGQRIASEQFSWTDDPFIASGLGSRLYDSEGLPAKKRVIIEKGLLRSYFIDCYYGRKLGMEPTTGRGSNGVFALGERSLDELIADMGDGLLITGFIGGNSNSTTGDFSVGIRGMLIIDGELSRPVSEMNMAGNMSTLLMQLAETGNDPYLHSSLRLPSMLFTDVDLSGA